MKRLMKLYFVSCKVMLASRRGIWIPEFSIPHYNVLVPLASDVYGTGFMHKLPTPT